MSKTKVFFRTGYNYDRDMASLLAGTRCQGESKTQQHFKDECDINHILRKFNVTGLLPQSTLSPRYGDFSGIGDYQSCLDAVLRSQNEFDALPGALRARFGNDPANLIDFLGDEANRDEAIRLGLVASSDTDGKHLPPVNEPPADGKASATEA